MKPAEPNHSIRRLALYYFVAVAAIPVAFCLLVLFIFSLWFASPGSGGDEFARLMNTGKGYYEQDSKRKELDRVNQSGGKAR